MKSTSKDFTPRGIVRAIVQGIQEQDIDKYLKWLDERYPKGVPLLAVAIDYQTFIQS